MGHKSPCQARGLREHIIFRVVRDPKSSRCFIEESWEWKQACRDEGFTCEEVWKHQNLVPFVYQRLRENWRLTTVTRRNSITVRGMRPDGRGYSTTKAEFAAWRGK